MNETKNEIPHALKPHAEALTAIYIWGHRYSQQKLGCMDWWDTLAEGEKRIVRQFLDRIAALPRENAHHSHPGLEREE